MIVDMPVGTYRPCSACAAPVMSPFPETWHIDLIRDTHAGQVESFYTPHTDACTQPAPVYPKADATGIAVRIAGHRVTWVTINPPPVPAARADSPDGYLYARPSELTDWIPLGATVDGFRTVGPLHWLDGVWPVHLNGDDRE